MQGNFGSFESYPARFTRTEAWVFMDGAWRTFNVAEVNVGASVMTEQAFNTRFGQLPALPAAAFQSAE